MKLMQVSVLFLSSVIMKEAFMTSSCTTVQADMSFYFDASKYMLCAFCYLNVMTNRIKLGALAFLAKETAANFQSTFKYFKSMCAASLPSALHRDHCSKRSFHSEYNFTVHISRHKVYKEFNRYSACDSRH